MADLHLWTGVEQQHKYEMSLVTSLQHALFMQPLTATVLAPLCAAVQFSKQ